MRLLQESKRIIFLILLYLGMEKFKYSNLRAFGCDF